MPRPSFSSVFPCRALSWLVVPLGVVPLGLAFGLFLGAPPALCAPAVNAQVGAVQIGAPQPQTLVAQGTIRDAEGKPVQGALIEIMHVTDDVESIPAQVPVKSDEQGHFTIKTTLSPRQLRFFRQQEDAQDNEKSFPVVVHMPGWAVAEKLLQAVPAGTQELPANDIVVQRGYSASGQVVDDEGKPVAGVLLRARYATLGTSRGQATDSYISFSNLGRESALARDFRATSDATGHFTLRDLPQGELSLILDDARYTQQIARLTVSAAPTAEDKPTFTVRPAARATGRVLYPDGKPVSGIRVTARSNARRGSLVPSAVTKPDGTYDLGSIESGSVIITALAPTAEWVATSAPLATIKVGEVAPIGDLTLARGVLLTGFVREAISNVPIVGAEITATGEGAEQSVATTDARGQYQLRTQVGAHTFFVSFLPPDYIEGYDRSEVKVSAEGRIAPSFLVRRGQTLTGTAVDEKGQPAVGAIISVNRHYSTRATSRVNLKGEWTLRGIGRLTEEEEMPVGPLRFKVTGAWALRGKTDLVVNPNVPVPPVALVLSPITLQDVKVRVVTPQGKPVSGAQVEYKLFLGSPDEGWINEHVTSDEAGEITLPGLRPEQTAELTATKTGYALTQQGKVGPVGDVNGGANGNAAPAVQTGVLRATDIVMTPIDGKVEGRVLDAAGQPITGARVALLFPGDLRDLPDTSVLTDDQGHFALANLPPGAVTVGVARGRAFAQATLPSDAKTPVELKLGAELPLVAPQDAATAFAQLERWTQPGEGDRPLLHQNGLANGAVTAAALLALSDAQRAVRAMTDAQGKVQQDFVQRALTSVSLRDPARAVTLGKTLLPLIEGAESRSDARLGLAIATVGVATGEASAVYDEIAPATAVNDLSTDSGTRYAKLAALAAALGNPDAEGWLQALTLCLNAIPGEGERDTYLNLWAKQVGAGSLPTARQWAAQLPLAQRFAALCALVSGAARRDPVTARQILAEAEALLGRPDFPIDAPRDAGQYATPPSERLSDARFDLANALMAQDAHAAQEVAQGLPTTKQSYVVLRGQIQALAATPQDKATLRATLDAAGIGWFNPPGMLAWLASLLRETLPQLSAQGFTEARAKLAQHSAFGGRGIYGESVAVYAYARAPFDPAESRLLLENEWLRITDALRQAKTKGEKENVWQLSANLSDIARAMIPLDLARANEMLETDAADDEFSYDLSLVRVQMVKWLLADAQTRRTMLLPNSGLYYQADELD